MACVVDTWLIATVGFMLVDSETHVAIGGLLIGFASGIFGTRIALLRARLRLFRTYRDVTDWNKVDELLRQ